MSPKKKVDFSDYPKTERVALGPDVAAFLIWASKKHPMVHVSPVEILQRINYWSDRPSKSSKEVEAVRSASARVRKLLKAASPRRGLVVDSDRGWRATVDASDYVTWSLAPQGRRLGSAVNVYTEMYEAVKIMGPLTAEARQQYADCKPVGGLSLFAERLLPPKRKAPEGVSASKK